MCEFCSGTTRCCVCGFDPEDIWYAVEDLLCRDFVGVYMDKRCAEDEISKKKRHFPDRRYKVTPVTLQRIHGAKNLTPVRCASV